MPDHENIKNLILIGRGGCGKATLARRLTGKASECGSTQCADRLGWVIDELIDYFKD